MCLAQRPQRSDAGEARTHGSSASTLPLSHYTPIRLNMIGQYKIFSLPKLFNEKFSKPNKIVYFFVHALVVNTASRNSPKGDL